MRPVYAAPPRSLLPRCNSQPARARASRASGSTGFRRIAPGRLAEHRGPPPLRPESLARFAHRSGQTQFAHQKPVEASATSLFFVLAVASAAATLFAALRPTAPEEPELSPNQEPQYPDDMTEIKTETLPGRVGNLTSEQESKLRELWAAIFRVCNVGDLDADDNDGASTTAGSTQADKSNAKEKPKKRRITLFSRKGHKDKGGDADSASVKNSVTPTLKEDDADDKYGQNKEFFDTLANSSPESIRATIWSMVKHDHPDALALRFLRARKWDVEKALVMMVSTMNWRANEMHVDDEIMKNGEEAMAELSKSSDPKQKLLGDDFMAQIRMGKSFLHGLDDKGRPMCVVRVRLHHQGEQCEESLERYTVYLIETARMVLRPPVDTATIVFDMTGFSMANMDYTPVKFMIKCFEANYPESLGSVLVHKAPWIFQGIWKLIRSWLDPVVASKVHFTNNLKDLEDYVSASRVPKELEGNEDWTYNYVEPQPGENDKLKDTATRDGLLAAREQLYKDFEEATLKWIKSPQETTLKTQRNSIATKLRADYWVLDPYVRARSLYDRIGWIQGEKVVPYPTVKDEAVQVPPVEKENGDAQVATAADDVD